MSRIKIHANNDLGGTIKVPASKSILHRFIVAALLTKGTSVIHNATLSLDIIATLKAIEALGAKVEIDDDTIKITGINSFALDHDVVIDCGESGSTLRFLIPICTLFNRNIKFIGKESLFVRPLDVYEKIFHDNNATFIKDKDSLVVGGKIDMINGAIDGSISSQFISGLLFILALRRNDTTLRIKSLQSRPYVLLTIEVLKCFGIHINYNDCLRKIKVPGNQIYRPAMEESSGDFSQAANFFVLKALTGANINILGLNPLSYQGDKQIIRIIDSYFQNMPIKAKRFNKNFVIDVKHIPDLGPILMVLLTHNGGYITNFRRLIFKESNRVLSMTEELRKFGVVVKELGKKLYIPKYNGDILRGDIEPHNDHRVLMAMVMMALIYNQEAIVNDVETVNKSYPDFFSDLEKIGVKIERYE